MTDYIAWLLEEEPEEEGEEAPAFTAPRRALPRRAQGADAQTDAEEETEGDSVALRTEAMALRARAKEALPLPKEQRQGGGEASALTAAEGVRPEFALSASTRRGDLLAALQREKAARGDALHARFAEGRRRASFAEHPPQERSVAAAEPLRLSGGGLAFDPLELDRCFERDARRYDNGLTY